VDKGLKAVGARGRRWEDEPAVSIDEWWVKGRTDPRDEESVGGHSPSSSTSRGSGQGGLWTSAYNRCVRHGMSALNGGESADEHRILATTFISIHGIIAHVSEPFPYPENLSPISGLQFPFVA
jgi:hypothetical protein